ncbi:hypothetical protein BDZ45DRAFT_185784 [Acephala macrosclerotiorum]|nr:hypothetical protein BDZ45DRAFT_185784 [Acephala macrosclerotiorum]
MKMAIESLYPILDLAPCPAPSRDEIRKAYRAKALTLHPDKNQNDPQATARFQNLKKAYDAILCASVTIEEVAEDISEVKCNSDDRDKDDDFFLNPNMPRRERKKAEAQKRKVENTKLQDQAKVRRAAQFEEEASKLRIDRCKFGPKQEGNSLQFTKSDYDRVLVLTGKLLNHQRNKKQPRAELDTSDVDSDLLSTSNPMIKSDRQADIEGGQREKEFEIPLEFIDPMERHRIMETRRSLLTSEEDRMEEQEEEDMEKARVQAEKMKAFWKSRKGAEVKPDIVHVVPKAERDTNDNSLREAAVSYTRRHLSTLARDEVEPKNQLTLRNIDHTNCTEMTSNTNLAHSHYVAYFCRERGGWKEQRESIKQCERPEEPLRIMNSWGQGAYC